MGAHHNEDGQRAFSLEQMRTILDVAIASGLEGYAVLYFKQRPNGNHDQTMDFVTTAFKADFIEPLMVQIGAG